MKLTFCLLYHLVLAFLLSGCVYTATIEVSEDSAPIPPGVSASLTTTDFTVSYPGSMHNSANSNDEAKVTKLCLHVEDWTLLETGISFQVKHKLWGVSYGASLSHGQLGIGHDQNGNPVPCVEMEASIMDKENIVATLSYRPPNQCTASDAYIDDGSPQPNIEQDDPGVQTIQSYSAVGKILKPFTINTSGWIACADSCLALYGFTAGYNHFMTSSLFDTRIQQKCAGLCDAMMSIDRKVFCDGAWAFCLSITPGKTKDACIGWRNTVCRGYCF